MVLCWGSRLFHSVVCIIINLKFYVRKLKVFILAFRLISNSRKCSPCVADNEYVWQRYKHVWLMHKHIWTNGPFWGKPSPRIVLYFKMAVWRTSAVSKLADCSWSWHKGGWDANQVNWEMEVWTCSGMTSTESSLPPLSHRQRDNERSFSSWHRPILAPGCCPVIQFSCDTT